jgi:hypothetical protein
MVGVASQMVVKIRLTDNVVYTRLEDSEMLQRLKDLI